MSYPSLRQYAGFLLENHLNEFVDIQIKRAREMDIPLLKLFNHYSENELKNFSVESAQKFLLGIIDETIEEDTFESSRVWSKDQFPGIGKADLLISDITLIYKLRKEGLIVFLKKYTRELEKYEGVLLEIEELYSRLTQLSFGFFIEVQQELLVKEKQLTEKVLDSSLSSIVAMESIRDSNNRIIDFKYIALNSEAEKTLGSKAEFVGHTLLEKFPTVIQEGMFEKYHTTVETGESFDTIFHYTYEGFNNWFRQVGVKWDDGLVITTYDITELKRSEEEIRNLNKGLEEKINERTYELQLKNKELRKINEDLDNFVYTASHDLKAPVSNLEGLVTALSEIIGANGSALKEKEELIHFMETSIIRFKNTIQELTDITKIQKQFDVEIEEVSLSEIWEEVKHLNQEIIENTDASITADFSNCDIIKFSKSNLRSVLFNLLNNALKYSAPDRGSQVSVFCERDEAYTCITIQDNGLGIPRNNIGKVFSMFKRFHSHVEGSGIGLYIVKRIIENAGGKIEVHSEVNRGTTFKIRLKNNYSVS